MHFAAALYEKARDSHASQFPDEVIQIDSALAGIHAKQADPRFFNSPFFVRHNRPIGNDESIRMGILV